MTIRETTRRRLADYKRGDSSFDDVLNRLMDEVPLEDIMEEELAEHRHRLATFQGIPADEFIRRLDLQPKSRSVRR